MKRSLSMKTLRKRGVSFVMSSHFTFESSFIFCRTFLVTTTIYVARIFCQIASTHHFVIFIFCSIKLFFHFWLKITRFSWRCFYRLSLSTLAYIKTYFGMLCNCVASELINLLHINALI